MAKNEKDKAKTKGKGKEKIKGKENGNGNGSNGGEEFQEFSIPLREFTPTTPPDELDDVVDYGAMVNDTNRIHQFTTPYGTGTLEKTKVTYFVPKNRAEYAELTDWFNNASSEKRALQIFEFRKMENHKFPVLITERVKTTLIRYIEQEYMNSSDHEHIMAIITFLNDIFNALSRASKENRTCPLKNIFIGEDGVVRLPFVLKTSDTIELDIHLNEISTHLIDETYGDGWLGNKSPDLKMLKNKLRNYESDDVVFELFKSTKFPLSDYKGIQDFLLQNVDYVKDVTVYHGYFSQDMAALLDTDVIFWESEMLTPLQSPLQASQEELAYGEMAENYNLRRGFGTTSHVAPPRQFTCGPRLQNPTPQMYYFEKDNRNCPLQFGQLSRNARAHQHSYQYYFDPNNATHVPYPSYIQRLTPDDLYKELCKKYPGVYTSYYLTLCEHEPQNMQVYTWC